MSIKNNTNESRNFMDIDSIFQMLTSHSIKNDFNIEWRKFHNKELHDLYSSPSIIRIIKSRRMRWAGHVARMGGEDERL
jgi:hypothetical protein